MGSRIAGRPAGISPYPLRRRLRDSSSISQLMGISPQIERATEISPRGRSKMSRKRSISRRTSSMRPSSSRRRSGEIEFVRSYMTLLADGWPRSASDRSRDCSRSIIVVESDFRWFAERRKGCLLSASAAGASSLFKGLCPSSSSKIRSSKEGERRTLLRVPAGFENGGRRRGRHVSYRFLSRSYQSRRSGWFTSLRDGHAREGRTPSPTSFSLMPEQGPCQFSRSGVDPAQT